MQIQSLHEINNIRTQTTENLSQCHISRNRKHSAIRIKKLRHISVNNPKQNTYMKDHHQRQY
jgi:hypothetical protein